MGRTAEKNNVSASDTAEKLNTGRKKKLKYAADSVIFVLIFLFLLRTVSYIVRTNGGVKDRFSGFYAEPKNTIDAVLIGSSPVYPYYSTPQMFGEHGIAAYPLSSNLQRPAAAIGLMDETYKRQKPKLFIFEMRMYLSDDHNMTNNMAYTRGVTDNLKYSANRVKVINRMVVGIENKTDEEPLVSYYFDIMKYHSNWGMLFIPYEWRNWDYTAYNRYKGYEFKETVGPCRYIDESAVTGTGGIPPEQEADLKELLTYLKSRDQDALFIVSPYLETAKDKKEYNYLEEMITAKGYKFIDLNDHVSEMGLDYGTDIADYGTHVNALGAEKCTEYFGKYLSENYSLPDRRNDKKYQRWARSYQDWLHQMPEEKKIIESKIEKHDYFVNEDND